MNTGNELHRVNLTDLLADARLRRSAAHEIDFGDAVAEYAAALSEDVITPMAHVGCIRASGADVDAFLQGQFSNDIHQLTTSRAQLTSWNSAKGRVLALFTALRTSDAILLETSRELVEPALKRLRMFVLRSKVQLEHASESWPSLGVAGDGIAARLAALGLPVPEAPWDVGERDSVLVLRRPGSRPRFTVHANAERLQPLWQQLSSELRPVGTGAWQLLDILAGMPSIVAATQDHFVAQMLNLDQLGGISFSKGCYTGQEVIARLHYLGNLKRRMFLGYCDSSAHIEPGTAVHVAGGDGQAVGEVVASAPDPARGQAALVVLQLSHADSDSLRIGRSDGPALARGATLV
jgi:hypothetical protein